MARAEKPRWLVLVHQLPPTPSNVRVRVWRRLQQIGAVVLRNSLYVLPLSDETREDFNWMREEIVACGGQVSVLEAVAVDGLTDTELIQQFRNARTGDYEQLAAEVRRVAERFAKNPRRSMLSTRDRALRVLRERFLAVQARDYFGAAGRLLVEQALREAEAAAPGRPAAPTTKLKPGAFKGRTWVTRARPGIDRVSSAWLIRRFIAPDARFVFVQRGDEPRGRHIPFDMPEVEFGHRGSHCTFETLIHRFGITDPGVLALSRIVHDLDLKENKYAMPEAAAVSRIVDGLRATYADDDTLLEQGIVVIEALFQSFAAERRPRQPRRTKR